MVKVIVAILFSISAFYILATLYLIWGIGKWFYHDILGWHQPKEDEPDSFDGSSYHNHCKYCGKDIMQDSQGNWF